MMGDERPTIAGELIPGSGDGVLVLLHSLALDGSIWDAQLPDLTSMCTVVRCDLPGHGRSAHVTSVTVERMADDVDAFLQEMGISRANVVGLSLGGCVAQSLAIRHPARVSGVGLFGTTAWYGKEGAAAWANRAERARRSGLRSLSEFQLSRWFTPGFRADNPELCERILDIFSSNDLGSYLAACEALGAFNFIDLLDKIDAPAFVVVGEFDAATPLSSARQLAAGISGAELTVVPGASHLSPFERPDIFIRIVSKLLAASAVRERA